MLKDLETVEQFYFSLCSLLIGKFKWTFTEIDAQPLRRLIRLLNVVKEAEEGGEQE